MNRTLSEQKALKKLGMSDFRHMTSNNIAEFSAVLPYMEKRAAKNALEQIPAFKDLTTELVAQYKSVLEKVLEDNKNNQEKYYDACNAILESLQHELEKDNITAEERDRIEDKMIEVARMMGAKDSENKKFLYKVAGAAAIGIAAIIAAVVGVAVAKSDTLESNDAADTADDYPEVDDF